MTPTQTKGETYFAVGQKSGNIPSHVQFLIRLGGTYTVHSVGSRVVFPVWYLAS